MPERTDEIQAPAERHAWMLLGSLGLDVRPAVCSDHPALGWRRTGLMTVTGPIEGPGLVSPAALTSAADGALAALKAIAPKAELPETGAVLLSERARLLGLTRQGATSPNGSCRLFATRDGHIALNLPRAVDWASVPALFGAPANSWADIARLAADRNTDTLLTQGRLLSLAIAANSVAPSVDPFTIEQKGEGRHRAARPLVVDLSSLWAGPLAGSLLRAVGARVIKVESVTRPDGARGGHAGFYDLLNAGKESVALDFSDLADLRHLRRLIALADIVIDASRPRALAGLGIMADEIAERGATWVSITAHGRIGDPGNWVGFGDDAAVAGGLSAAMALAWGEPMFAGDAIADPLTGITAALAAWASWLQGGGRVVSLALAGVVAHACDLYTADSETVRRWQAVAEADTEPFYPLRALIGTARPIGIDTNAVLGELA